MGAQEANCDVAPEMNGPAKMTKSPVSCVHAGAVAKSLVCFNCQTCCAYHPSKLAFWRFRKFLGVSRFNQPP
eukprot:366485-Chlamydomonas_euryale.AAC.6